MTKGFPSSKYVNTGTEPFRTLCVTISNNQIFSSLDERCLVYNFACNNFRHSAQCDGVQHMSDGVHSEKVAVPAGPVPKAVLRVRTRSRELVDLNAVDRDEAHLVWRMSKEMKELETASSTEVGKELAVEHSRPEKVR